MADNPRPDEFLDCVGLFCPEPLFQTRQKLDELEVGEILEVIADDPAAEEDLKRFCKRTGQELLSFDQSSDGAFHFLIKKIK
ncbi:MAG TPA: sulfurtransferase TusA family protein [Candidatus Lokiarchaeia archaeon]|nr:sulfurtransferase TusA family protein [Candidatus Lokiarchaeia archaeon]